MGNRERLLEGAKQCLQEKGFARTTARDLVAASGTNLASIGYHFGSKEALLDEALIDASADWFERLATMAGGLEGTPLERFRTLFDRVTGSFAEHRGLVRANLELIGQAERSPDMRKTFDEARTRARDEMAPLIGPIGERDPESAKAVGALMYVLLAGLMVQFLVDPAETPDGDSMARAIHALTADS